MCTPAGAAFGDNSTLTIADCRLQIADCIDDWGMGIGDWIADWRLDCGLASGDWIDNSIPNRQSPIQSTIITPIGNRHSTIRNAIGSLQSAIGNRTRARLRLSEASGASTERGLRLQHRTCRRRRIAD